MLRRIVLTKKTGQLGNRLMVAAHAFAAALEHDADFYNPALAEYSDWFEGPRRCLARWRVDAPDRAWTPRQRSVAYALARCAWEGGKVLSCLPLTGVHVARARNEQHLDLRQVVEAAQGRSTLLLQGYHFRHAPWALRHASTLREFLRLRSDLAAPGSAVITSLRQQAPVVVGVHLRHGDYRHHLGGRFFWPVSTYRALMERLRTLLAPTPVAFLVCSNAQHDRADFSGWYWQAGPGTVPGDLQALSECDYLFGPPSSFSSWAAFAGHTRLLRLEDPAAGFVMDDFVRQDAPETRY